MRVETGAWGIFIELQTSDSLVWVIDRTDWGEQLAGRVSRMVDRTGHGGYLGTCCFSGCEAGMHEDFSGPWTVHHTRLRLTD